MASPRSATTPLWKIGIIVLVGLLIGLIIYGIGLRKNNAGFHPVSMDDLRGVWTTSDPRYEDRFLQFDGATVTFGWGEAGSGSYRIADIDSEPDENGARVHVRYRDRSQTEYQLNFHYATQQKDTIRLNNPKEARWYRTSDHPLHEADYK